MTSTSLPETVKQLLAVIGAFEREDLADRTRAAALRATRSDTVVCVVGEFKQGKSSLVNALVRRGVCPVDDDLATSVITLIKHGDPATAVVRRSEDGKPVAEVIDVDRVGDYASEQGNPGNEKAVDRVDVALPSALLKDGLTLVDTPGMGGLGGGHAAATMAFLPFADGLVLVSDSSSELTAPEAEFLRQATELCPNVMLAETKTDLYPSWEQIVELDKDHLKRNGIDIPVVAVSSYLRDEALRSRDKALNLESGYPQLLDVMQRTVTSPAKSNATQRAVSDLGGIAMLLRTGAEEELRLLNDPEARAGAIEELERATARLEHLRGPAARWSTVLGDRITDMQTSMNHRFRGEMRAITREVEERVEELSRGSDWEEVTRDVQTKVSETTARAFGTVTDAWVEIHRELAELLQAEDLITFDPEKTDRPGTDLTEFWQGTESVQSEENSALAGVRSLLGVGQSYGSSSYMISNVSGISKFGISLGALAAGPVLVGGFVVMGGMKIFDDQKRKITARKQKLRSQIRSFTDNVQFEVSDELSKLVREVQRSLRDEFLARIGELQTTHAETIQRVKADSHHSEQQTAQRKQTLEKGLVLLDAVDAALEGMTS